MVEVGTENENGGVCVDTKLWPSVLTACHKFQTETKSMKANIISCFPFVPPQNYHFFRSSTPPVKIPPQL